MMSTSIRRDTDRLFNDLWLMGTLAIFVVVLAISVFTDIESISWQRPIDWRYTVEKATRYGYVLWFLSYFYVSTLRAKKLDETLSARNKVFYLLQSAVSLYATFSLGMLAEHHGAATFVGAIVVASSAIGLICLSSRLFFSSDESFLAARERILTEILSVNEQRASGVVTAIATIVAACYLRTSSIGVLLVVLPAQLTLWYLLWCFWQYSIVELETKSAPST